MSDTPEDGDATKGALRVDIPPYPRESSILNANGASTNLPNETSKSPTAPRNDRIRQTTDYRNDFVPLNDGTMSSWSTNSDKQLGSPGSNADRVFPIRSVVSVDPSQTPYNLPTGGGGRLSGEGRDYFPPGAVSAGNAGAEGTRSASNRHHPSQSIAGTERKSSPRPRKSQEHQTQEQSSRRDRKASTSTLNSESDKYGGRKRMQLFNDAGSENSHDRAESLSLKGSVQTHSLGSQTPADQESIAGLLTARFKHIVTEEGHAVITGRDGETLQRCEDEPIHMPGAIQSFGLLIALEEQEEGNLIVRVVSENSKRIIGYTPQELFKLKSFTDILSEEQCDNLLDHVDFIRDEEADPASNGPEVFTLSLRPPRLHKRSQKFWCAMHINPAAPNLIICEFEVDDDQEYPLVPPNDDTPEPPENTLNSKPTEEEYMESTQNTSKPLRVLRSARKRKGEAAAMEVFNIMSQVQEQLASAPNLKKFLKILVGVVKELTGFQYVCSSYQRDCFLPQGWELKSSSAFSLH
jgi:hypothetical protein